MTPPARDLFAQACELPAAERDAFLAQLMNEANAARAKLAAESGTPSPVPPKD